MSEQTIAVVWLATRPDDGRGAGFHGDRVALSW